MLTVSNTVLFPTTLKEHDMTNSLDCDQLNLIENHHNSKSIQLAIHSLMCYRQNGESPEFARRAIESLVKKIKDRSADLDALVNVISTGGADPGRCVTIQRTLDGRMQISGRKCLPHIMYARIWRWPDLHRNELKHLNICSFGFSLKRDSICINPYHYERVEAAANLCSAGMSPCDNLTGDASESGSEMSEISDHFSTASGNAGYLFGSQKKSSQPSDSTSSNYPFTVVTLSDNSTDSHTSQTGHPPATNGAACASYMPSTSQEAGIDRVNPPPHIDRGQNTMAWSGIALPQIPCALIPNDFTQPPCLNGGTVPTYSTSSVLQPTQQPDSHHTIQRGGGETGNGGTPASGGSGSTHNNVGRNALNYNAASSGGAGGSSGSGAGWGQRGGGGGSGGPPQSPFSPSGSLLQPVPVLTSQRPPEFWCNIAYFELDQQVGELFKVPSQYSRVTVDGYTDPSSPNRFCLGQLSNVHRSEQSEKSRLYIGKGVELDNVGEGDVWIRCLSEFSVFVQSYYLDREAGRRPGDAVHKIYPGAYIKVFDIRQCHEQMKLLAHTAQVAAEHQAAVVVGSLPSPTTTTPQIPQLISQLPPGPSQTSHNNQSGLTGAGISPLATVDVGVDDLRRLCMLRLSFVKGWGPDYPRRSIKETPCWIEIQLHRPLQLLDEVLQGMPLNDRKPTRHFFPYYSQPQSQQQSASRPPQAATRRT